jgi:hypothetical protein
MNKLLFCILCLLSSCNTLPQLYQAAENVADDEAIRVSISKEALQKETNLSVSIDLINSSKE